MEEIYLEESTNPKKKYMVTILRPSGNKKTVHFGGAGYSDFTIHKDPERMERYNIRHKKRENWTKSGVETAGFWSKWLLWSQPSLSKAIKYTSEKFNIKIKNKISKKSPKHSPKKKESLKKKNVAVKSNTQLWEKSKEMACKEANLCKHSARKMQWATRYYKSKGGKYSSPKSSNNSLKKWGKEKWRTYNNEKSKGKLRYLPSEAWENLSPEQIKRTNKEKEKGYNKGKQYVKNPNDVAEITREYRSPKKRVYSSPNTSPKKG